MSCLYPVRSPERMIIWACKRECSKWLKCAFARRAMENGSATDFRAFLLREKRQELVDYFLEV